MNKKISMVFRVLALVVALLLVVSGCGKAGTDTKKSDTAPSATAAKGGPFVPEKPITLMVPYSPGGSTDLLARTVEKVWSKYCPQQVLIVNKPGAAGLEGTMFTSRAKPDGYTLELGYGSGIDLVSPQLEKMTYDPFKDLVSVARLSVHSVLVAVPANSPFNSIKDVIDWAKKENKPVTAAVSTAAGAVDIVMRGIGKTAGINVTPVPHAGGSQAITTLIGGNTMMGGGHPAEVMPQLKDKRIKPIGIALKERDKALPDIPTLAEQGLNFYTWGSVKGIAAPPNTPKEIIAYYEDLFKKISEDADYKKAMADMLQPVNYLNAADYDKFMKEAYADYGKLIKDLGLDKK